MLRGGSSGSLVQGDVPGVGDDLLTVHREVTRNQVAAKPELASRLVRGEVERPDFVLWPEKAIDPVNDSSTMQGIASAAATVDVPSLVGAIVAGARPETVLNQGIVVHGRVRRSESGQPSGLAAGARRVAWRSASCWRGEAVRPGGRRLCLNGHGV